MSMDEAVIVSPAPDHECMNLETVENLAAEQDQLKDRNVKFVQEHPELKQIITDFVSACLFHKPDDIYRFAFQHFKMFAQGEFAELLRQKVVYTEDHEIDGHNMSVTIEESYDRTRWMTVRAEDLVTGESRLAEFSETELCGKLGVSANDDPEKVANVMSTRLRVHSTIGLKIGEEGASPSVAACSAALQIQAVQRGKKGREIAATKKLRSNSAKSLQTRYRGMRDRAIVKEIRLKKKSSTCIQAQFRGRRSRMKLLKQLEEDAANLEI